MDMFLEDYIEQVVKDARRMIRQGTDVNKAIAHVANEFLLSPSEREILLRRLGWKRNKVENTLAESQEEEEIIELMEDNTANSIEFTCEEEQLKAVGMLMYKGIPWSTKGNRSGVFYLGFDSPELLESAKEILSRKWHFVENEPRRAAVIEFDNLEDYHKVLEFMDKQNMIVEITATETLDEKLDDEDSLENEEDREPDKQAISYSPDGFVAYLKDKKVSLNELDVFSDKNARFVKVRKSW